MRAVSAVRISEFSCFSVLADQILRSLEPPMDIDPTKVSATLRDGILTIDLPKAPYARAVRVEPKSS